MGFYHKETPVKPTHFGLAAVMVALSGCQLTTQNTHTSPQPLAVSCQGSTALPAELTPYFEKVTDPALLTQALGQPLEGKLCQGAVYQVKANQQVTLYRTFNSTNPNSKFGSWWTFNRPEGKVAKYRENLEICYQWSPIDRMVQCKLKAGSKVVVGNGQSARCSEYLTYDVSSAQQVFMQDANTKMTECTEFDAQMAFIESPKQQ